MLTMGSASHLPLCCQGTSFNVRWRDLNSQSSLMKVTAEPMNPWQLPLVVQTSCWRENLLLKFCSIDKLIQSFRLDLKDEKDLPWVHQKQPSSLIDSIASPPQLPTVDHTNEHQAVRIELQLVTTCRSSGTMEVLGERSKHTSFGWMLSYQTLPFVLQWQRMTRYRVGSSLRRWPDVPTLRVMEVLQVRIDELCLDQDIQSSDDQVLDSHLGDTWDCLSSCWGWLEQ